MNTRTARIERSTSTAHRLLHYDGACGNIHGHNMEWEVFMEVSMEGTDSDNMPVDFKTVSDMIDETDHAVLLNEQDPLLGIESTGHVLGKYIVFGGDPTCELVSQWMADRLVDELDPITSVTVILSETDKYGMTARASSPRGQA